MHNAIDAKRLEAVDEPDLVTKLREQVRRIEPAVLSPEERVPGGLDAPGCDLRRLDLALDEHDKPPIFPMQQQRRVGIAEVGQ